MTGTADSDDEPSRLFLGVSYTVLVIGGVVIGVLGAFLLPYSAGSTVVAAPALQPGVDAGRVVAASSEGSIGQLLSLGLLFALIANPALSWAGMRMAGTRLAAFAPLLGWIVIVLWMSAGTTAGDSILGSNLRSGAFLVLGVISFMAVGVLGRPTRGGSALLGQPLVVPTKSSPGRAAPTGRKRR